MDRADSPDRLTVTIERSRCGLPPIQPRHTIEPLFGFVEFRKISVDYNAPWFTREKNKVKDKFSSEQDSINLLAENIELEGVLEPLHVLYTGDVPEAMWDKKAELAQIVSEWKPLVLAIGFRRYLAIRRAIDKGEIAEGAAVKVPVRIYLKGEIEARTGERMEYFLTKAAVSSNVFFKGYTPDDKIRITRTLIEQIRAQGRDARHRDILHLLGIKKSESAAEHRASLRRFAVCNNDRIYRAFAGLDDQGNYHEELQVLTFNVAEQLANRLGRSEEFVDQFLEELDDEIAALRQSRSNGRRKNKPPVELVGYDSKLYCRWIDNLRDFGDTRKDKICSTSFSYQAKLSTGSLSLPGIRLNLKDDSEESIARVVDVTFKLKKVLEILDDFMDTIRPSWHGKEAKKVPADEMKDRPIGYGEDYKEFIRWKRLEAYANVRALRRLYNLDAQLRSWVLAQDLDDYLDDNQPPPDEDENEGNGDEEENDRGDTAIDDREGSDDCPDNPQMELPARDLTEKDVGERQVNLWVVNKVAKENAEKTERLKKEKSELENSRDEIERLADSLPVMAGTFAAYSKSLSSFHEIRNAMRSLMGEVKRVAEKTGGFSTIQLSAIEQKLDRAVAKVEAFTPDREVASDVTAVFKRFIEGKSGQGGSLKSSDNNGSAEKPPKLPDEDETDDDETEVDDPIDDQYGELATKGGGSAEESGNDLSTDSVVPEGDEKTTEEGSSLNNVDASDEVHPADNGADQETAEDEGSDSELMDDESDQTQRADDV